MKKEKIINKDLSDIVIPLPELRQAIAHEMARGTSSMNLENLLMLIRMVYRESIA